MIENPMVSLMPMYLTCVLGDRFTLSMHAYKADMYMVVEDEFSWWRGQACDFESKLQEETCKTVRQRLPERVKRIDQVS